MAKKVPVDTQQLRAIILRQVDEMRKDTKHCDFLIKVGSEEIPVHRNIICATSDYFDAMFSHPTQENKSGIVQLIDVDTECAIICVDHMYGKEVSILPEKYEPLMYAANLMQLHTLSDAIETMLEANLDPKTFFTAKRIANMYECEELAEKCRKFAEAKFGLISKEEAFGELDKNYILGLIKPKRTKISEEEKLGAVLKWIKHDTGRKTCLLQLLACVDLTEVPAKVCSNLVENEPIIAGNNEAFRMFSLSVMKSMRAGTVSSNTYGKGATNEAVKSSIVVFDRKSGFLQCFNPRSNQWNQMQEMNVAMKNNDLSAVTLDEYIYAMMSNRLVYRLKYTDNRATWAQMHPMLDYHGPCPPATVLSGFIYVIGGHGDCMTKSVERNDPRTLQWTKLREMTWMSQFAKVLGSNGYIFSFGGFEGNRYVNHIWRLDPTLCTWSRCSTMNEEKINAATTELGRKICVLGGNDGKHLLTVELVDIANRTSETLKPMMALRSQFKAFAIDGFIYAVGGYYSSPDSIEKYDVKKNEWEIIEIPTGMKLHIRESVEIDSED